jgi:hypothetical protein
VQDKELASIRQKFALLNSKRNFDLEAAHSGTIGINWSISTSAAGSAAE